MKTNETTEEKIPLWVQESKKEPSIVGKLLGKKAKTNYQGLLFLSDSDTRVFYTSDQKDLYIREYSSYDIEGREVLSGMWFDKPMDYSVLEIIVSSGKENSNILRRDFK